MQLLLDQMAIDAGVPNTYVDYSQYHFQQKYFEGTGVLIFDNENHKVYVNRSQRTDD